MELQKFQEKLDTIHEIMGYGLACGDINFYQGKVLGKVLECLEELSMEISKVNNEKFPLS